MGIIKAILGIVGVGSLLALGNKLLNGDHISIKFPYNKNISNEELDALDEIERKKEITTGIRSLKRDWIINEKRRRAAEEWKNDSRRSKEPVHWKDTRYEKN